MIPAKFPIPSFTAGDHLPRMTSSVTVDGLTPATPLESARLRFQKTKGGAVVELSSEAGEITIADAATWTLLFPRQAVPGLTAGVWKHTLELTDTSGVVDTYGADTLTILTDV